MKNSFIKSLGLMCLIVSAHNASAQPLKEGNETAPPPAGPILSIQDFLNQVREQNDDYKSAKMGGDAVRLYLDESVLALSPSVFGNVQISRDYKPSTQYTYDHVTLESMQVGLSQNTSMGLSGRVYYSVQDFQYSALQLTPGKPMDLHVIQASPTVELTLPLWRNWLGTETNAQIEQSKAQNSSSEHNQNFKMQSTLVQAVAAYWSLALARESLRVSHDAIARNEQLVRWHTDKMRKGLSDRSDLLQAEAALEQSHVEYKTAQDNETAAARGFNLARGKDLNVVAENLMPLTPTYVSSLKIPKRAAQREDLRAALDQTRASKAATLLADQKYRPTLELFGSAALNNGNLADPGSAIQDSFHTDRPTNMIGIRVSAPLDAGLIANSQQGHAKDAVSAEIAYQRKILQQENDWNGLVDKFNQARDRFQLYQSLESKQKEKFDYERQRRTQGRTTTQQVLNFERDYEAAQLGRLQTLSEFLQVYVQMRLYDEVQP